MYSPFSKENDITNMSIKQVIILNIIYNLIKFDILQFYLMSFQ